MTDSTALSAASRQLKGPTSSILPLHGAHSRTQPDAAACCSKHLPALPCRSARPGVARPGAVGPPCAPTAIWMHQSRSFRLRPVYLVSGLMLVYPRPRCCCFFRTTQSRRPAPCGAGLGAARGCALTARWQAPSSTAAPAWHAPCARIASLRLCSAPPGCTAPQARLPAMHHLLAHCPTRGPRYWQLTSLPVFRRLLDRRPATLTCPPASLPHPSSSSLGSSPPIPLACSNTAVKGRGWMWV